jgi:uncharacterized membrane protein
MGVIFLLLFAVTLFVLYIAVRRSWGDTTTTGAAGVILSVAFIIAFSLLDQKTSTGQAVFSGIVVGIGFPVAVIIIAVFFRANQPAAEVKLVSRQEQKATNGPRDDSSQTPE